MTAPLVTLQLDPDARPFTLRNGTSECLYERLDVGKHDRRRRRSRKDRRKRFAVFGVYDDMIAKSAITFNKSLSFLGLSTRTLRRWRAAALRVALARLQAAKACSRHIKRFMCREFVVFVANASSDVRIALLRCLSDEASSSRYPPLVVGSRRRRAAFR